MTGLSALWLPILLSAVFVFVASSILHMALPWHKSDYKTLPNEDKAMDALRALAIPPGDYMVPRPSSRADMSSPAFAAKLKKGPVMVLTVMPSGPMSRRRFSPYGTDSASSAALKRIWRTRACFCSPV